MGLTRGAEAFCSWSAMILIACWDHMKHEILEKSLGTPDQAMMLATSHVIRPTLECFLCSLGSGIGGTPPSGDGEGVFLEPDLRNGV